MLARAVPGLRLGPRGFELPHGLTEEAGEEATRTLPDGDRYLVELLAHLDATAPVSLWAQVAQRRRSELLRLSARLVDEGMASVERGTIRLRPSLRRRLLQQAATTGQSWDHHVAIASVLDAHDTLPMRRGQAWLDAGEHVRGVTVWLDHWRELLDDQGYEVLEGLLRDAQDRVRSVPPTEAVHGRLDALLPTVAARNYGNASASKGLARYRAALEQDWYDVAVDHLRWAMVCSDPSQRQGLLAEGMEALRDHCAPAAWAALLVYGVLAAPQWGRLDLEGPLVRSARRAVERAEADPDAGHSTIISAPLVPRLRHRLEAAIAAAQGDHVAEASALRAVVDVALSGRSPTLHADQVDLGLALLASGDAPAAEQVFLEGERRARWIGSWADAAGFATQRAGMAAIDGDWDRAARLARRALLGLVDGYPVAMMRLFATMPAVADGHLGTLFSEMDEIVTDLALVHPVDDELRRCMDVVLARLRELEQPVPASWNPLLELL